MSDRSNLSDRWWQRDRETANVHDQRWLGFGGQRGGDDALVVNRLEREVGGPVFVRPSAGTPCG